MTGAPVMDVWRCSGQQKDGRACGRILLEYEGVLPAAMRKICDKCHTVNVLRMGPDRVQSV